ncbi:uncharacterized protein LOC129726677 [Wyeomyia smithii]|uniref:uncharacterized protein LOC129726677 n=1 Tax=Wyeomyia smithii TaxID=174621 RepID=UPI002467F2CA|nr:uncharacterized protein LOC129726677 [Wyeomyia smithii]
MMWEPKRDIFLFSGNLCGDLAPYIRGEKKPTKRTALRCIMSLFDPLGLLAPYLIHGRMLIQDIWRSGVAWDDEMLDEDNEKWKRWTGLLESIGRLEIPRFYFGHAKPDAFNTLQLPVFCDASEAGLGCAAYFRVVDDDNVYCSLVMAKSKVAPLKHQSIPRMELHAFVLGARLMRSVCESHTVGNSRCYLWTASSTVLSWVRSDHRRYMQYVAHRVGEIQSLTKPESRRWVPTRDNVADALTKWGKDTEPVSNGRWFRGPSFLYRNEAEWPLQKVVNANTSEELRARYLLLHIFVPEPLINVARISKWKILVRTVAQIFRFINNCRLKRKRLPVETVRATPLQRRCLMKTVFSVKTPLRQTEYQNAEQFLLRIAQGESYPDEVKILINNRDLQMDQWRRIEKNSALYRDSPFADEWGVLTVDGRTANVSFMPFDARFPVILPKDHIITVRIVEHFHREFGHAGRETTVNELRQRYHIHHLRATVGKLIKNCQWCKIKKCVPDHPRMAPLPEQRLTAHVRPFCYVGVDYMGPLEVTINRRKQKRYVVVFTCLVMRAIHLEIAFDLSSDSCIMAIRRFVRRRGPPNEIFSDNGTNFVGANRELKKQIQRINEACAETFTDARTKWSLNPPSAPHMGGVWERMVRCVKEGMSAIDEGRKLNDEILLTVLGDIEYFVNSRPLTYMPQQSADYETLTPNHFIFGTSTGAVDPLGPLTDFGAALRSSYERSQAIANVVWDRWTQEYLPTINKRSRWLDETRPVKVGDMVYIAEGDRRGWI